MKKLLRITRSVTVRARLAACEDGARPTVRRFIRSLPRLVTGNRALGAVAVIGVQAASAPVAGDQRIVAALDTQYQEAVKKNDADTMTRILADDFVLVTGSGKTYTRSQLLEQARRGCTTNTRRTPTRRSAFGAIRRSSQPSYGKRAPTVENRSTIRSGYTLWFSDTYVRTPKGWRYVFSQTSLPLPNTGAR